MIGAPIPENDIERISALQALNLLDTVPEERFDRITRLASQLLNVPIALVSLVDENRQWFKSRCGLDAPETSRDISFCGHAIMSDEIFYIPNAKEDKRFFDNPLVTGPPYIISYAGKPLKSNSGHRVGTLCMIDTKPRILSKEDFQLIEDIGAIAENEINVLTLTQALKIQKESERQVREVMDNVDEGLCLITSDKKFGPKYSLALPKIFETNSIAGRNFFEFVKPFLNPETFDKIGDFVNLLFKNSINEDMLLELNPLEEEPFFFENKTKYLSFYFKRVYKEKDIEHIVITINDNTLKVELKKQLEIAQKKTQNLMEKTFDILHVDPVILEDFIKGSEEELDIVKKLLLNEDLVEDRQRIDGIFRAIHSIKGDSALLGLNLLSGEAHSYEDKISEIRDLGVIHSENYIVLNTGFERLKESFQEVKNIINKLSDFQKNFNKKESGDLLLEIIERQIQNLTEKSDKKILFEYNNFRSSEFPLKYRKIIKDVLIQLVRNSIDHGIENSNERERIGKPKAGKIEISSKINQDTIIIFFKDDGSGIDLEKLKKSILKDGKSTEEELGKMSGNDLFSFIFKPGISTAEKVTSVSGRGVGMDLVKKKIDSVGGNIRIETEKNQFCNFEISLPM